MVISKKNKFFRMISLSIFLVALISGAAFAADYYVSPTGSAPWPTCTTIGNPCLASSSSKAFLDASAGDTVWFLDGTYSDLKTTEDVSNYKAVVWEPTNSGSSGKPITFKAINRRQVFLEGLQNTRIEVPIFGNDGGSTKNWWVFDGFVLSAATAGGSPLMAKVNLYYTNNVVVNDCEIIGATHSTGGGINYEGVRIEGSQYTTISNNEIHGFNESSSNQNTSAIKTYATSYTYIYNNEIYNNHHGVYLKGNGNSYADIYNNFVNADYWTIHVGLNSGDQNNHTIRNNIIIGHGAEALTDGGSTGSKENDLVVYNNTFYADVTNDLIHVGAVDVGKGPIFYNNIFYHTGSGADIITRAASGEVLQADHNIYYNSLYNRISKYSSERTYSTLSSWQSSGELEYAFDAGCGSSTKPGCGSLVTNPNFTNGSGSLNTISDFAVSNTSGRSGGLIGADVSTVGTGFSAPPNILNPDPSPLLIIIPN